MYKELVKQLRSTVSRSKRTLFDDAADAIELLQKELREERHRHDRIQDFEVAEAEQLRQMRIERDMLAEKLREKESVLSLLRQGKQPWRDAKTDPPTEPNEYIVIIRGGVSVTSLLYDNGLWFEEDEEGWQTYYSVTHWMPLPEPPEEVNHDL